MSTRQSGMNCADSYTTELYASTSRKEKLPPSRRKWVIPSVKPALTLLYLIPEMLLMHCMVHKIAACGQDQYESYVKERLISKTNANYRFSKAQQLAPL